jgi:methionyl-tRNA formyltransferase
MKKTSETVVFFGSGPVAAESLQLLARDFNVEAVITKPKPPHHRGAFPVISLAEKLGIKTYLPANKRELSELFKVKPVNSRLGIVIDYGIIINQDVIDHFPLGIVNSHFSLLPEWRGADPITFAILSGQQKTGVSLMVIDAGLDTGKLITQRSLAIEPDDTTPTLTSKLIMLSHELLVEYLPRYVSGEVKPRNQPHPDRATYSRLLTKEDGLIDWQKPAVQLEREVRAFAGWPKSRTNLAGKEVIITKARATDRSGVPGTVSIDGKRLIVATGEASLIIEKLKPAGKNEMTGEAFIAGHRNLL